MRDVLAIGGERFRGIAASGEIASIQPPDFVAEIAQQIVLVRNQQNGGSAAAQSIERSYGAGANQRIVLGEGVLDEQHIGGSEVQGVGWSEQSAGAARG